MKLLIPIIVLIYTIQLHAQIPVDYFKIPLKIPIALSGTFGELRSNHFHSGLDIKTQGKQGLNVYASAEGYVSRIKISSYGYGKALYIQHPNGYTTVYAHLKKFSPKIEAFVKAKQYEQEKYSIELFPSKQQLKVTSEEVIALSGNSGGSGGPHLHFEIRDAQQRPMNPMLFGFDIKDTRRPLINTAWIYPLDDNAQINGNNKPYRLKITTQKDGTLKANSVKAFGNVGIAVSSVDQQDAANNKNGYYLIESSVNGTKNFELEMKRFSFSETRYLNRMIDYEYFKNNKSRITKLFIEPNNPLSIYKDGNGYINIEDSLSYNCSISIKDIKGNTKQLLIPITGKHIPNTDTQIVQAYEHYAYSDASFEYSNAFMSLNIPKGALYDDTPLKIKELVNNRIQIHKNTVPLHKYMSLSFSLANTTNPKQSYIGRFYGDATKGTYVGSKNNGERISARTRDFGSFGIFTDLKKPTVKPLNFSHNKWISNNKTLRVWINDKETGIKNYKATINGKFALMEYDYKKKLLVHYLEDGIYSSGKNDLKIYVEDNVGNNTIFETTFYRK